MHDKAIPAKRNIFASAIVKHAYPMLVVVTFLLAAFLYFRNLNEAVFFDSDEARAFTLLPSGPLLYLICFPVYKLFHYRLDSVFYAAGSLGFLSVFIFYAICRFLFGNKIAAYAAFVYAIFPMRHNYARTLYPPVFIEFFVLLLILFLILCLRGRRPPLMAMVGIFSAALIFIHPSTYCILLGVVTTVLFLWFVHRKEVTLKQASRFLLWWLLGFILCYWSVEYILRQINNDYFFTLHLIKFGEKELVAVKGHSAELLPVMGAIFQRTVSSVIRSLRFLIVSGAVTFAIYTAIRKKNIVLLACIVYMVAGLAIFILMSALRFHTAFHRYFLWICPILSICLAFSFDRLRLHIKPFVRILVVLCMIFFVVTSVFESYLVGVETFRVDEIKAWLAKNKISKNEVISDLQLYSPGDKVFCKPMPVFKRQSSTIHHQQYQINWPIVCVAHQKGLANYIIPMGPGAFISLEEGDVMLLNVKPIKSWLHPNSKFKYRYFGPNRKKSDPENRINAYRIADIFSMENFQYLKKLNDKTLGNNN